MIAKKSRNSLHGGAPAKPSVHRTSQSKLRLDSLIVPSGAGVKSDTPWRCDTPSRPSILRARLRAREFVGHAACSFGRGDDLAFGTSGDPTPSGAGSRSPRIRRCD